MRPLPFTPRWRAPTWAPLFVRRRWLGVWTQAEVDAIKARAAAAAAEARRYIS